MPHYKYIALNKANARLAGTIQAASDELARKELNNLGLSVLDMQEMTPDQLAASQKSATKVFTFNALDANGKKVSGTIKSIDEKTAYNRLINEYGLAVQALLVDGQPCDLQKIQQAAATAAQQPAATPGQPQEEAPAKALSPEEKDLQNTVTETVNTVYDLLKNKGDLLKEEYKASIKKRVDKLLLIKSSSNTSYIRNTCSELLQLVKNPEIYLDTTKQEQAQDITAKTEKILYTMEHTQAPPKEFLGSALTNKLKRISEEKLGASSNAWTKFKQKFAASVIAATEDPPEIKKIKAEIASLKGEFWYYVKQWFVRGKERSQMTAHIQETRKKIQDKKIELAKAKERNQVYKSAGSTTNVRPMAKYLIAINTFTGWLLSFYLAYYFVAYIFAYKNTGIAPDAWNFNIFEVGTLKTMLIVTFIAHAATSIKITFFRYSYFSGAVIFGLATISGILLLANI